MLQSVDLSEAQAPSITPYPPVDGGVLRVEHLLPVDGQTLSVREVRPVSSGRSHWVLLVHGNTFSADVDFDLPLPGYSLSAYLAERGLSCCHFDHRGYGRSSKPTDGRLDISARVRDLARVLSFLTEERGARSVDIVALSTGCNTTAELLRTVPTPAVRALVFLGPCYLFNPFLRTQARRTRVLRSMRRLVGCGDDLYVTLSPEQLEHRLRDGEEALVERYVVRTFIHLAIDATASGAQALTSPVLAFPGEEHRDLWQPLFDADAIRRPTLIIRGGADQICCEWSASELEGALRSNCGQVRLITVPDRKHDMHLYREHQLFFSTIYDYVC